MTELGMSIQEAETLIFEIQDSTSDASKGDGGAAEDGMTEVDSALMRLDAKLEVVRKEFAEVEKQVAPLFDDASAADTTAFLRRKWIETSTSWESIQKDAEMLSDELKEDKWLTVFRTVSQQAEDMMTSLEKVLKQSHEFIWDLNRRQQSQAAGGTGRNIDRSQSERTGLSDLAKSHGADSGAYFGDPASMQPLLSSFVALHRSLHAKIKYYSPACDRVLKILGKGIADRSTKNGEVLRRFGEMKQRWRNLLDRIGRIESEMKGVEDMLREAASPSSSSASASNGNGNGNGGQASGKASPFRRLANKMSSRSSATSLASAASSPASTPTRSAMPRPGASSSSTNTASPPRPPRSDKRSTSSMGIHAPPPSSSSSSYARPPTHRPTRSVTNLNQLSQSHGLTPPTSQRYYRSPSPAISTDGSGAPKPRWNISTKRDDSVETLKNSHMPYGNSSPARPAYGNGNGGRASAMGMRSSSRMSLARSVTAGGKGGGGASRPISPAMSNFSDASSYARERPMTPSRIPGPAPLGSSTASSRFGGGGGGGGGGRSTTPFSSLEDPEPTSLLQRTMSPTPSPQLSSSTSTATSVATTRSHIPVPSSLLPPRAPSPSTSSYSAASSFSTPQPHNASSTQRGGQTPEPHLITQAARLAHIRLPSSRPPPVPQIPSSHRSLATSTPKPSSSSRPPRASSALSSNFQRSYSPNPRDPLDVSLASVVNSLPILLRVERLDPPLARNAELIGVGMTAKYAISLSEQPRRSGQGPNPSQNAKFCMCSVRLHNCTGMWSSSVGSPLIAIHCGCA
ncbi:hypothetical protein RQP46_010637 [Phenoliferia psychrophenolica]